MILRNALTHVVQVLLLKSSQLSIFPALPLLFSTPYFFLELFKPQFTLFPEDVFVKVLLYGNPIFDENDNREVLETSIRQT